MSRRAASNPTPDVCGRSAEEAPRRDPFKAVDSGPEPSTFAMTSAIEDLSDVSMGETFGYREAPKKGKGSSEPAAKARERSIREEARKHGKRSDRSEGVRFDSGQSVVAKLERLEALLDRLEQRVLEVDKKLENRATKGGFAGGLGGDSQQMEDDDPFAFMCAKSRGAFTSMSFGAASETSTKNDVFSADANLETMAVRDQSNLALGKNLRNKAFVGKYDFGETVIDAAFMTFVHTGDVGKKVVMITGFVVSLLIQMLLLLCVGESIFRDRSHTLDEDERGSMMEWRSEKVSFEERALLCNQHGWAWEGDDINGIRFYLDSIMPGWFVCCLCVITWTMTGMVDLGKNLQMILAIMNIPIKDQGPFLIVDDQRRLCIEGITRTRRLMALFFVSLPKLCNTCTLVVAGNIYLSYSLQLSDLFLNVVALGFISSVDEIVAKVFFTRDIQAVLLRTRSLSCGFVPTLCNMITVVDILRFALFLSFFIVTVVCFIVPFVFRVQEAGQITCDMGGSPAGLTNFTIVHFEENYPR